MRAMDVEIRPIDPSEHDAFLDAMDRAFGEVSSPEDRAAVRGITDFGRTLAAFDRGRLVATAGSYEFDTTVPGGAALATSGVTWVSVQSSHRRRGIMSAMMRRILDDGRDKGEPLAGLWASESSIYARFGYGMAIPRVSHRVETAHSRFVTPPPATGEIRMVEADEAARLFPALYDSVRPLHPGLISRSEAWWKARLHDFSESKGSHGPRQYAVHETNGEVDGYVIYRMKGDWDDPFPAGRLTVLEHLATSPAPSRELWRFLLDVDLVTEAFLPHRPVDDHLPWLLADPRRARTQVGDGVWLRFLDIRRAMEMRSYATEGALVFEVEDDFCPWVAGRYELAAGPGGATFTPSIAAPDLRLHSRDLAAAYMGAARLKSLAVAGRGSELTPGALDRADQLLWSPDSAWALEVY
jgi:predicted acetyltransferase